MSALSGQRSQFGTWMFPHHARTTGHVTCTAMKMSCHDAVQSTCIDVWTMVVRSTVHGHCHMESMRGNILGASTALHPPFRSAPAGSAASPARPSSVHQQSSVAALAARMQDMQP
eukprot:356348-Chlamydomonas_euryale.AAC.17